MCGWVVLEPVWKICRITVLTILSWLTYFYMYWYEFLYSYYDICILLVKVIVPQLVRQAPTFYGTQISTTICYLSLSWARSIQSTPSHPISWKFILLPSMPRSSTWLLSFIFPYQSPIFTCTLPYNSTSLFLRVWLDQSAYWELVKLLYFSL